MLNLFMSVLKLIVVIVSRAFVGRCMLYASGMIYVMNGVRFRSAI